VKPAPVQPAPMRGRRKTAPARNTRRHSERRKARA
jgi:hypothetical protein